MSKTEVKCTAEETNVTCSGDGELTRNHVLEAGAYAQFTYAKLENGITILQVNTFSGCRNLAAIDYPSTLVEIKDSCFHVCAFTTFHIKKTLTKMSPISWNDCYRLTTFTVESGHPSGYTAKNGFLMKNNDLYCVGAGVGRTGSDAERTITLPTCKYMLDGALRYNRCLAVVIHNDTLALNGTVFYYCSQMTTITLGKNLKEWSLSGLYLCTALTTFNLNGNTNFYCENNQFGKLTSSGKYESILWIADTVTNVTIGASVTGIGLSAFQCRPNLTKVGVESGNTKLSVVCNNQLVVEKGSGSSTFNKAKCCVGGAKVITVPESVTQMDIGCCRMCNLLTHVTLHAKLALYNNEVFRDCLNLTTLDFKGCKIKDSAGEAAIPQQFAQNNPLLATITSWPSNIFSIGSCSFDSCGFTSLSLPSNCIGIRSGGFSSCQQLESVTVPNTMTAIEQEAFQNCPKLKTVTFTTVSKLTTIGSIAFAWCNSLTTITLPCSVTSLATTSFASCANLMSILFNYNNGTYVSDGIAVYQKSGSNLYHTFVICPGGLTDITLNGNTAVIGSHSFYGCNKLREVSLSDKVEVIQSSAFYQSDSLELVRIPGYVKEIQNRAFDIGCYAIKAILYCSNRADITYTGDPFQTNPDIYLFYDFPGYSFCGHPCHPILDHMCNIPTTSFTAHRESLYLHRKHDAVLFYASSAQILMYLSV